MTFIPQKFAKIQKKETIRNLHCYELQVQPYQHDKKYTTVEIKLNKIIDSVLKAKCWN